MKASVGDLLRLVGGDHSGHPLHAIPSATAAPKRRPAPAAPARVRDEAPVAADFKDF
jgi:hypothetical protein